MSDRVTLNGRSTCNERKRDRNTHEPFLNCAQACLKHSHASLMIMHNDQTTYQTIHFKHNNNITWTKNRPGKQFKSDVTN